MTEAEHGNKYLVFARKWRPSTFADVTGQSHVVRALQNGIKRDRLPNAYIFSGIRGVGKTSIARILARSINCEHGPTISPCGECDNCKDILAGSSLDVIEIDGASNNGVDEVRDIRENLQYAPSKCRKKIYIVDEVHMLSKAAFNAFLKTLEEPPPHTLFVFATTELSKIPDTVISRCQCFEFRSLSDTQIVEKLAVISEKESISITEDALKMIARRADGSMRDAESLLDQVVAYDEEKLDESIVGQLLGLVSRQKIWSLLQHIVAKKMETALKEVNELYYSGYDLKVIIHELLEATRELTLAKLLKNPTAILNEPEGKIKELRSLAEKSSTTQLQQYYQMLLRCEYQVKSASNSLSVLEMCIIGMIDLEAIMPLGELVEAIKAAAPDYNQNIASVSAPSTTMQKAARLPAEQHEDVIPEARPKITAAPTPASAPAGNVWAAIKQAVSAKRGMFGQILNGCGFKMDGQSACISFPAGEKYIEAQLRNNKELLEQAIQTASGIAALVTFEPATKHMAEAEAVPVPPESSYNNPPIKIENVPEKSEREQQREKKKRKLNDPMFIKALEIFDGRPEID